MIELLQPEIQKFIDDHLNDQPADLMLKASQFPDWPMKAIVEQIVAKRKAKSKLLEWFSTQGLIWPAAISMEQCSSELTAKYKAGLVSGESMVDLTGGFGVDTYYLAKQFDEATHVEMNEKLHQLVAHNFKVLNSEIKPVMGTAEAYLHQMKPVDLIYIDPARRDDNAQRVVFLEDYSPNVVHLLPELKTRSQTILIKASPMLDIKKAIADLNSVSEVHVVGVKNEVKELLFLIGEREIKNPIIMAVNLGEGVESFEFNFESEEEADAEFSEVLNYLYEPNAAILKSGAFKSIGLAFGLKKLQVNSHLYTSKTLVEGFPGRSFRVLDELSLNKKRLRKQLQNDQANITVRNFPMTVKEIRNKTGLTEGGTQYIFATTDLEGKKVLLCEKMEQPKG